MSYMGRSIFGNFDQILTINIFFLSKTGRREKQQKQRCAHLEFNGDHDDGDDDDSGDDDDEEDQNCGHG